MPMATAPHWDSVALLVIDLQNDFLDGGALEAPGADEVLKPVDRLLTAFRLRGRPIVHAVRLYEPGSRDVDLPRRTAVANGAQLVAPGTSGSQIPAELLPHPTDLEAERLLSGLAQYLEPREIVLYKPRWSAFFGTSLQVALRQWGVDTVVVAGTHLAASPQATLVDASERDLRTVLVVDAVSGTSPERLGDLEDIGVRLLSVDEVEAALSGSSGTS